MGSTLIPIERRTAMATGRSQDWDMDRKVEGIFVSVSTEFQICLWAHAYLVRLGCYTANPAQRLLIAALKLDS